MTRRELVEAARGDRELDLVIRGGSIVNVYTDERYPAAVGVYRDRIAVVDPGRRFGLAGREEIDARGLTAIPGLIDAHVHIESTMVTPPNYARAVLPRVTTTVVIDPHEIANVLGRAGVGYMLRASEGLPLRTYLTVPSCVPAVSGLEPGAPGVAARADHRPGCRRRGQPAVRGAVRGLIGRRRRRRPLRRRGGWLLDQERRHGW